MSLEKLSLRQAQQRAREDVPSRPIRMIIWHHFWKPAARDYRGIATMRSVRGYHVKTRGWRDVGYNWLFAPNGDIFTGRSLQSGGGAHCIGHNSDSVGLGMCLNGDKEDLADFAEMERSILALTATLCEAFALTEEDLHFHRDFADKTCPGLLLDRAEYRAALAVELRRAQRTYVRLKVNDEPIRGIPLVNPEGTVVAERKCEFELPGHPEPVSISEGESIRALLESLGYDIPPHGWHHDHGPRGTIYAYGPVPD